MRLTTRPVVALLIIFGLCHMPAWSQPGPVAELSDAARSLQQARTAYREGDYAEARDLAQVASETDAENPDVFLLLGRAHYALGDVPAAMMAWNRTLRLAPDQTYARAMVDKLRGVITDRDQRIKIVESMVVSNLGANALREIESLRRESLNQSQRVELLVLEARAQLSVGLGTAALGPLGKVKVIDPETFDLAATQLYWGKAMLASDSSKAEGLKILNDIVAAEQGSPIGASARLALIARRIDRGEDVLQEWSDWMAANPEHFDRGNARRMIANSVAVYIEAAKRKDPPTEEGADDAADSRALQATKLALQGGASADTALSVIRQFLVYINDRFVAHEVFAKAGSALDQVAALDLTPAGRDAIATGKSEVGRAQASAELTLIVPKVYEGELRPERLEQWIEKNPRHPMAGQARESLFDALVEAANREGPPTAATPLSDADRAAIRVAAELIETSLATKARENWCDRVLAQLKNRYTDHGCPQAAISGLNLLLELELPNTLRRKTLASLADTQSTFALQQLRQDVLTDSVKAGPMPVPLAAWVKTLAQIDDEFPAHPTWERRIDIATKVRQIGQPLVRPARITRLRVTDDWSVELVVPVAVADTEGDAGVAAMALLAEIVNEASALEKPSAGGLAADTQQRLADSLAESHPTWFDATLRLLTLRVTDAVAQFAQAVGQGSGLAGEGVSPAETQMIAVATALIAAQPPRSAEILDALQPWLQQRSDAGHFDAVEQSYVSLEDSLPAQARRELQLALADSWVTRSIAQHDRMIRDGFAPPEALDQRMRQALVRCYQLKSDFDSSHPFVAAVQLVRSRVITHYRNLGYRAAASAAISVQGDQAVAWIDADADFELASFELSIALDDLRQQTQRFEGKKNVALTPAIRQAIAGLESVADLHPKSTRVSGAVEKILALGKTFEGFQKYDTAGEIYAQLEAFASEHEALRQAKPGQSTVAQQAALSRARALHSQATESLAKAIASGNDEVSVPSELSREFRRSIDAYQAIIAKYADSPVVRSAIGSTLEIALQHARVGSWPVAQQVYADLQTQQLPLRTPERLDLARALCEVGKVMPDHANRMLAAITLADRQSRSTRPSSGQIAGNSAIAADEELSVSGFAGMNGVAGEAMAAMPQNAPAVAPGSMGTGLMADGQMQDPFGAVAAEADASVTAPGAAEVPDLARATRQADLLAMVRQQQSSLATQVAMMRDREIRLVETPPGDAAQQQAPAQQQQEAEHQEAAVEVLSDAEIGRRARVLDVAYKMLQSIRDADLFSATATQAREEIFVIVNHWRSIRQWQRSAELTDRFLSDNPSDIELPQLRLASARDYLAWAAATANPDASKQELLDEVGRRFERARGELARIIAAFPDETGLKHQAQWDIATSHLTQARVVARFHSALARGQFVRAANELLAIAELYHDHPQIEEIAQMLSGIAQELTNRHFYDEAIAVWNEMTLHYPGQPLAEQAALNIAQTYQNGLHLPLRAVESYLELNFARGGNDVALQDAIFQIASQLMGEKRWVESLHVLETFVDSFPRHSSAGQALTMIGQVHQTNEIWEDAIAAYRRVILEYGQGNWTQQSKWSIAECTINLSRWEEAQGAYREYQKAYPEDAKVAEAAARLETLKDLARFQKVVDEAGQRKAFDAQFQIAAIVRTKLANPVKAIIEYRKVSEGWPESHLADDALFQVGTIFMELGQSENARNAFLATAAEYPGSPLADDALFQVGASFENEAQVLAGVTRGKAIEIANELAQRQAYAVSQDNRRMQRAKNMDQITQLKKEGKRAEADRQTAFQAALNVAFDQANASVVANWAAQQEEALTTAQLADRQDKINAALRRAVATFRRAAAIPSADMADDALLRMAQIYDQRLKDSDAAMTTWLEIVKQYSGTTVAEDASWKIAQYYETHEKYADAISAFNSFLRNYRRSPKASEAQAAIAENHEQLGNWVEAMDAYTNYINNYPEGALAGKAKEQIAWIKTYRL